MSTLTVKDGTAIYYKDWGSGRPILFSHGWPLSADAWDAQMMYFGQKGYRVLAHDRRGHGRSSQPWSGYDMDTFASDLSELIESLDLKDAILVAHSMGGGEAVRYLSTYGTKRIAKAVLIGAVPPLMLKTEKNPDGIPMEVFDGIRAGILNDRSEFFSQVATPFYGANRPGVKVSQGVLDDFWLLGMQGAVKAQYDCVKAFSETDFTEDLKKIDIPVLLLHGEDDQMVPLAVSSARAAKLLKKATLKVYSGSGHGPQVLQAEEVNTEILGFIEK